MTHLLNDESKTGWRARRPASDYITSDERQRRRCTESTAGPPASHRDRARLPIPTDFSTRKSRPPAKPRVRTDRVGNGLPYETVDGHPVMPQHRQKPRTKPRSTPESRTTSPISLIYGRSPRVRRSPRTSHDSDNLCERPCRISGPADAGQRLQARSITTLHQTKSRLYHARRRATLGLTRFTPRL